MSYRPICDVWWLARSKVKYYGAYPAGFLERAKVLLGLSANSRLLHICGGKVKEYPYKWFEEGEQITLDIDPNCNPDFLEDATDPFPLSAEGYRWDAILMDPPYTAEDASHYHGGGLPSPKILLENASRVVKFGGKVGLLHYIIPTPPKSLKFVASVAVLTGFNNRIRVFSVFERIA